MGRPPKQKKIKINHQEQAYICAPRVVSGHEASLIEKKLFDAGVIQKLRETPLPDSDECL